MDDALYISRARRRIEKAVKKQSRLGFAKDAGLAESTIREIGTDKWNPRLSTLLACERAARAANTKPGKPAKACAGSGADRGRGRASGQPS